MPNERIPTALRNLVCMVFLIVGLTDSGLMLWKSHTSIYAYICVVLFAIFTICYWFLLSQLSNPTKPFKYITQFAIMLGIAFPIDMMMTIVMSKIYVK